MGVYAGIDEAGYGPIFGPLTVGCAVLAADGDDGEKPVDFWKLLRRAVCKRRSDRKRRIAVNDSKKLHVASAEHRLRDLERGVLTFAALAGHRPGHVGQWLEALGETAHHELDAAPWYKPTSAWPWDGLPIESTPEEIAVAGNMLGSAAKKAGVRVLNMGAAVVFEQRFNQMMDATRSKAAVSFTFVSQHLQMVWRRFGGDSPLVVVDRQSGRMRHRELLSLALPEARIQVLDETESSSAYRLTAQRPTPRSMTVRFEVDSEQVHMPVALASMISKYSRELMMMRFQKWFGEKLRDVKPTTGYGADARRFWEEVQPHVKQWGIASACLRRRW